MTKAKLDPERGTSSGSCRFITIHPSVDALTPSTKKLNIILSFAETCRLVMSLQDRLQKIHRLNRASKEAKAAGVNLVVSLDSNNISIMPGRLTRMED